MKRRTEPLEACPSAVEYPICDGRLMAQLVPLAPTDVIRLMQLAANAVEKAGETDALAQLGPIVTVGYAFGGLCLEHPDLEWETEPIDVLTCTATELEAYAKAIAAECSQPHVRRLLRFADVMGIMETLRAVSGRSVQAEKKS